MKGIIRSFTIEGLNLERFIAMASEAGITFIRMKRSGRRLRALTEEDRLACIEDIANKGGWRFSAGRRHGNGRRLDAMLRHWPMWTAFVAALICLTLAMQLVWSVSIVDAGAYKADLEAYLAEQGVRPFIWRKTVDTSALREAIEWRYPDIAWADCGWRGATLQITLVQGTPQGETFTHLGAGDVVAERGGIVESIVTVAGTPVVAPGDVIHSGQVLIRGQERSAEEGIVPVMARGIVKARVWDRASVQMPTMAMETSYTGKQQQAWTVHCPWFDLWTMDASGFEHQDVKRISLPLGGLFLPFSLTVEQRMEAELIPTQRDMGDLQAEAGAAALRLLRKKVGFADDLVDKWVDYCMIEDEVLEAIAYGERIVDVAQPRRNAE